MADTGARGEHGQTSFIRAPLQDIDINMPHPPTAHLEPAYFVKINRVRADESAPVIIDLKDFIGIHNPELGAEREAGPIRGGADNFAAGEPRTDGVPASALFAVSVGGSADIGDSPFTYPGGGSPVRLGCTARSQTSHQQSENEPQISRHLRLQ